MLSLIISLENLTTQHNTTQHRPPCTQYYEIQKGFDKKFVPYYTGGVYVLTFSLSKLITFADFNYASMYPMCV